MKLRQPHDKNDFFLIPLFLLLGYASYWIQKTYPFIQTKADLSGLFFLLICFFFGPHCADDACGWYDPMDRYKNASVHQTQLVFSVLVSKLRDFYHAVFVDNIWDVFAYSSPFNFGHCCNLFFSIACSRHATTRLWSDFYDFIWNFYDFIWDSSTLSVVRLIHNFNLNPQ